MKNTELHTIFWNVYLILEIHYLLDRQLNCGISPSSGSCVHDTGVTPFEEQKSNKILFKGNDYYLGHVGNLGRSCDHLE